MSDDLRARIRAAVLDVRLHLGPNAIDLARRGESIRLSGNEADTLTDAVMAAVGQELRPPLVVDFGATEWSAEQVAQWTRAFNEAPDGPLKVLPPNAPELWRRRTPAERRAYLQAHRDEAIARGIPQDLIDLMIQDAENNDA